MHKSTLLTSLFTLGLLLFTPLAIEGRERVSGWCEQGGNKTTTGGLTSTESVQQSFPSCTVTIYDVGTLDLASIFADDSGTVKSNPFTASATGFWFWYANDARYDVRLSGGGIVTPFTIGDILLDDTKNDVTTIVSVASSATPTFDASLGTIFTNTLTANVTSSTISNPVTGQRITLYLAQDGTGGWTFAWPANVQLRKSTYVVADDISAVSVIKLYFDGTNWRETGRDADEVGYVPTPVTSGGNLGTATRLFDAYIRGNEIAGVRLVGGDLATIQAAHDNLPAGGGVIVINSDETISSTLTLSKSNVSLLVGSATTLTLSAQVTVSGDDVEIVCGRGGTVTVNFGSGNANLYVTGDRFALRGCTFDGASFAVAFPNILVFGADDAEFTGNRFINHASTQALMQIEDSDGALVESNWFTAATGNRFVYLLNDTSNTGRHRALHNKLERSNSAFFIHIDRSDENEVGWNYIRSTTQGASLEGVNIGTGDRNFIHDNTILDTGDSGIVVLSSTAACGSRANSIVSNIVAGNDLNGIGLTGGACETLIANNSTFNNGQGVDGSNEAGISLRTFDAISVHPVQDTLIVGNLSFDNQGSPTQAEGISLLDQGTGAVTNTIIQGNYLFSNVTADIEQSGDANTRLIQWDSSNSRFRVVPSIYLPNGAANGIFILDSGGTHRRILSVQNGAFTNATTFLSAGGGVELVDVAGTTSIHTVSDAGVTSNRRLTAGLGTTLVAGDIAIVTTGAWGDTANATVGSVTGKDQWFQWTITAGGANTGANPTIVITFTDGAWTVAAPIVTCNRQDFNAPATVTVTVTSVTTTVITLTFDGTPTATNTYKFSCHVGGV